MEVEHGNCWKLSFLKEVVKIKFDFICQNFESIRNLILLSQSTLDETYSYEL